MKIFQFFHDSLCTRIFLRIIVERKIDLCILRVNNDVERNDHSDLYCPNSCCNKSIPVSYTHLMGPEGGKEGGYVVCTGTPEEIAECSASYTGMFLKEKLRSCFKFIEK